MESEESIMARTNATDVKAIIDTTRTDAQVDGFITTANLMVTEVLTGSGLSSAMLTEIEKYLAAHLMAMTVERQASKVKIDDASESYGSLGKKLKATSYGQTVLTLDTTGSFLVTGKPQTSIIAVTSFD